MLVWHMPHVRFFFRRSVHVRGMNAACPPKIIKKEDRHRNTVSSWSSGISLVGRQKSEKSRVAEECHKRKNVHILITSIGVVHRTEAYLQGPEREEATADHIVRGPMLYPGLMKARTASSLKRRTTLVVPLDVASFWMNLDATASLCTGSASSVRCWGTVVS
jgi:hypothetical protein